MKYRYNISEPYEAVLDELKVQRKSANRLLCGVLSLTGRADVRPFS